MTKQIDGQISITEYISDRKRLSMSCSPCICQKCLYWWSSRCPNGGCYDDFRAKENPYDKAHPDNPPRTTWTNWNKPGEQAHWCRGGAFYPTHYCEGFTEYSGSSRVQWCLRSNVQVFQDGYIHCSIVESVGCGKCYEEFIKREDEG